MDKKLSKEQEKMLLQALENAKAYSKKLREDSFNRLWKETDNSFSLYDAIFRLTKDEIHKIRKAYNFQGLSSLNKADLALKLSKLIPQEFDKIIYRLDQNNYNLIKSIVSNSGKIKYNDMDIDKIRAFMEYSIIFPGIANCEKILFMPKELIEQFHLIEGIHLKRTVERNTQWIQLTQGMLHFYGVMETWAIMERIEELRNEEIDFWEFMNVLNTASDFGEHIEQTSYGYKLSWIIEPQKIVQEHEMRQDVDFYPFTINQLLKASAEDYVEKTPELNRFNSFILDNYDFSDDELEELALQLNTIINIDSKPTAIIEYLQNIIEIPSFEFAQELNIKIMDLHNGTRQWALKGYSPNEFFRKKRGFSNPFPHNIRDEKSNLTNLQPRKKIGRNEPCPCGSGKKYKRCCGKS